MFGVTLEESGLNPMTHFQGIKYDYNVTKLIGLQFSKTEKLDPDVIKMFMICNAEDINKFNEDERGEVNSLEVLEVRFDDLKKAAKMDSIIKVLAPKDNVSLSMQLQTRFREKMNKMMNVHLKNQALEQMEERMQQIFRLDKLAKDQERDEQKVDHHKWLPDFQSIFNGFSDMFISLFGE